MDKAYAGKARARIWLALGCVVASTALSACYEGSAGSPSTSTAERTGPAWNPAPQTGAPSQAWVPAAGSQLMVGATGSFVVSDTGLYRVGDGKVDFVGPLADRAPIYSDVVSTDDGNWLVASSDAQSLSLFTSTDAGLSWQRIGGTRLDTSTPIYALDLAAHGSVVVVEGAVQSGSAFSFAVTIRSVDGGKTWVSEEAPTGGAASYAGGFFWLTGGQLGNLVFQSKDGSDWAPVDVPVRSADWTAGPVVDVATQGAVLPVTIHASDAPGEVAFIGLGGGQGSMKRLVSTSIGPSASGSVAPTVLTSDGRWFVVTADGSTISSGSLGSTEVEVVNPEGLPADVTQIAFDGSALSALATPTNCPSGKPSCAMATLLLSSSDLGWHWITIAGSSR